MLVIKVSFSSSLTKVQPLRTVGSLGEEEEGEEGGQCNLLLAPLFARNRQ